MGKSKTLDEKIKELQEKLKKEEKTENDLPLDNTKNKENQKDLKEVGKNES